MRITNNMIMKNYATSLNSSLSGLNSARIQAETGRKFQYSFEDPGAAASAIRIENEYAKNEDYLKAVTDTVKWQDTQEDALTDTLDVLKEINNKHSIEALSDVNTEVRGTYAESLRNAMTTMVFNLNSQYGDAFVLGGNDAQEPPFKLEVDGTVTYRGLDVSDVGNDTTFAVMEAEKAYVDLGFGIKFDALGNVVESSAFNAALPGVGMTGYGKTADGMSKNVVALVGEMADTLDGEPFDRELYEKQWALLGEGIALMEDDLLALGSKSRLLENTEVKLEDKKLNLTEHYDAEVSIETAEAITNFTYEQYIYNLTLKMGTNILNNSLLDFMS